MSDASELDPNGPEVDAMLADFRRQALAERAARNGSGPAPDDEPPPPTYAVDAVNAVGSVSAGQGTRTNHVDPYAVGTRLDGAGPAEPTNHVPAAYAETRLDGPVTCGNTDTASTKSNHVRAPWPELHRDARQGLAGQAVGRLEEHTEADPAAILGTFLAAAGVLFHCGAHVWAGDAEHPARIWPLVIGATAGGMKGTSWAVVRRVLAAADPDFVAEKIDGGLSSGEGLIECVHDPDPLDPEDQGVEDKRLLVIETEFAAVLARCRRKESTLGATMRQAWDGTPLRTMTRKNNRLRSTGHHITVIGHITPRELALVLAEGDLVGGTMNRFLPVLSRRSQRLPDGGGVPDDVVDELGEQLAHAVTKSRGIGRVRRTDEASQWWRDELYAELTPDGVPDGAVAHVVARAVPQVLRLSLDYALLDCKDTIGREHLAAGMAFWRYVVATAETVFGDASGSVNPNLDKLTAALRAAGELSREDIRGKVFQGNLKGQQIEALLSDLRTAGKLRESERSPAGGKGRKSTWYSLRDDSGHAPQGW